MYIKRLIDQTLKKFSMIQDGERTIQIIPLYAACSI